MAAPVDVGDDQQDGDHWRARDAPPDDASHASISERRGFDRSKGNAADETAGIVGDDEIRDPDQQRWKAIAGVDARGGQDDTSL